MKSLAFNDRSHFYAPAQGDIKPLASRGNVIKAFQASNDPVTFAETLAHLEGGKADGAFVGDTLDTIQNFHNLLRTMVGDEAEAIRGGSPFHFVAECLQISNFITWQRHIEGMVTGGAQHLELHPELVDDKNFKVTREMLGGFGAGEREFNFLSQRMNDFGFSLEQLVREAHANKGTDKPILRPEVDKAIQQLTLNEITLESSLTSRMPALQTSGLGVAMNPFLGWPLQKTYQVLRQLREPNGEATGKAMRNGLAAYLAILPVGMAVAWLRNKFDEDVLGRKQNISDLSNIHDVKSGLLTALDNASRVGTFVLIGEGANTFLNDDNVRPMSLDSCVFFLNTLENTYKVVDSLYHQTGPQLLRGDVKGVFGEAKFGSDAKNGVVDYQSGTLLDYQTVVRPLFQTLGGNGLLQNLGALNHLLAADDTEARVANRISVNNYLRVAGHELNMDVRSFGGMMQNQTAPNPIKPFIGQMVLAAMANDHEAFRLAVNYFFLDLGADFCAIFKITAKSVPIPSAIFSKSSNVGLRSPLSTRLNMDCETPESLATA